MHTLSLLLILMAWLFAWREGMRWTRACGVKEPMGATALACVLPTAGLIASIHLMALASLLGNVAWVTPEAVLCLFIALVILWRVTGSPGRPLSKRRSSNAFAHLARVGRRGGLWIPLGIVVVMYAVFMVDAATRYPTGYDSQAYHLPMAVTWMRHQRLDLFLGDIHHTFPDNGMLVPFLLAFARLESLFPLVHLPKGLLAGTTVYGLIRVLGLRRRTAVLGAVMVLGVPIVLFQSFSDYIDLYAAASWLSALLALAWAARATDRNARRGLIIMAGLSAGVALGSKTTYLVLVPMLGLVVLMLNRIGEGVSTVERSSPWRYAAVFGASALVCSSFWFVRGASQAGNPVYPLEVRIGDHELLPGYTAKRWFPDRTFTEKVARWWDYPWHETKYSGTGYPYGVNNGLGAAYAAFVPLGVLAAFMGFIRRERPCSARRLRGVVAVLSLIGVVLVLTVFEEMLRFVLPLVILSVVAAGGLIERLSLSMHRPLIAVVSAALVCTAAVATLEPAHALAGRIKDGAWDRPGFYEVPGAVDALPAESCVLNLAPTYRHYALLGRDWTNRVISPDWWVETYRGQPMTTRMLYDQNVDYIYMEAPWPTDWPDDLSVELVLDTEHSKPRDSAPTARLYRVLPAVRDARLAATVERPPMKDGP